MKSTIIMGCGGHGRSVGDIVLFNDPHSQIIYVDEAAQPNEKIFGFEVMREIPSNEDFFCIVGIGENVKRKSVFKKILESGRLDIISVVSKRAHVGHNARVGSGCFVGNYCHVGPSAEIGNNSILNNACVVDHEVSIGHHCHVGPNATISGRSSIGDLVFIGVGATVIDGVTVCSNVTIGAGATVIDSIVEPGTYVGTPARKLASQ